MAAIASANKSRRSEGARHSTGGYYTPPELARVVVRRALEPLLERVVSAGATTYWRDLRQALGIKIIDPACGDGNLLVAAAEYLVEWISSRFHKLSEDRLRGAVVRRCLYGIDLQLEAVAAAERRLLVLAGDRIGSGVVLARHLRCADSLLANLESFWPKVAAGGFDAVVGNPPFVDAETMARTTPERRTEYCVRWKTAGGNWDLSVPFVELSVELARPGGQISLVLPNKLLSARYAAALRKHLRRFRLRSLDDFSAMPLFAGADVYPIVMHVERSAPSNCDTIEIAGAGQEHAGTVAHEAFARLPDDAWHLLLSPRLAEYAEIWRHCVPLGTLAEIRGAATVAEAYAMADAIVDGGGDLARYPMVNTGTLRRFSHAWGLSPLRYLGRSYLRPMIARSELQARWPRRAAQAGAPKVIVAGIAKELRAYFDARGELLAAKSTVVITSSQIDLRLLAALLNSRWMSEFYRAHYGGLALQGGYLQFTTAHLRALPFPSPERLAERRSLVGSICTLVEQIQGTNEAGEFQRLDQAIESAIMALSAA